MQWLKNIGSSLYRLPRRYKIAGALVLVLAFFAARLLGGSSAPADTGPDEAHVAVASVASLSDPAGPLPITGKVTSVSKANILANNSGQVVTLSRKLGDRVAVGTVIASFENASQRAAVLQAQGAYDAAVAGQQAVSPVDARVAALNAYTAAFTTLETTLEADVDTFFGGPTPYGPDLLIDAPQYDPGELSRERAAIRDAMNVYRRNVETADNRNPATALTEAQAIVQQVSTFLTKLATAANRSASRASATQLDALAAARTSVNSLTATLSTAQQTYRSQSVTTTSSADANVTSALGGLRAAQAALEKTIIRAPISGTIVSLPINKGDYISPGALVAAISNPGALQIEAYVTSQDAKTLAVSGKATIEDTIPGRIVFIAPAIDPSIGKIQVTIGIERTQSGLTDGDTVAVSLERAGGRTQAGSAQPISIPIAAAKITPQGPVVFTVVDGALVAHPITFGDVVGSRVRVESGVTPDMVIVVDARGLADGQRVIATPAH